PVVASDVIKNGKMFSTFSKLIPGLSLLSHRVNDALEFADPAHFEALKKLHAAAEEELPFLKLLNVGDPLLQEGREIMFNRKTPLHADRGDLKAGWAALVALGGYKGGAMSVPAVNLRMRYTTYP
ncbi:hypothetical protein FB451DRAFT_1020576, partial [Mycena latifolia]